MTHNQKLIWAAVFAAEYSRCRAAKDREFISEKACTIFAAEVAGMAVNSLSKNVSFYVEGHSGEGANFVLEMGSKEEK